MGKGGYGVAAVRWLRVKTEKKKIYGIEHRTKSMNYSKTVNRKGAPKAPLKIYFNIYRLTLLFSYLKMSPRVHSKCFE
jgi:hypothetical protein